MNPNKELINIYLDEVKEPILINMCNNVSEVKYKDILFYNFDGNSNLEIVNVPKKSQYAMSCKMSRASIGPIFSTNKWAVVSTTTEIILYLGISKVSIPKPNKDIIFVEFVYDTFKNEGKLRVENDIDEITEKTLNKPITFGTNNLFFLGKDGRDNKLLAGYLKDIVLSNKSSNNINDDSSFDDLLTFLLGIEPFTNKNNNIEHFKSNFTNRKT